MSWFKLHNSDYLSFWDKKGGKVPPPPLTIPSYAAVAAAPAAPVVQDPAMQAVVVALRADNSALTVRCADLAGVVARLEARVCKLFDDTSETNGVVQELKSELGEVRVLQEGLKAGQEELRTGQDALLDLRQQDLAAGARKDSEDLERRRFDAEELKQVVSSRFETFESANKLAAEKAAAEAERTAALASAARAVEKAEAKERSEKDAADMKAWFSDLFASNRAAERAAERERSAKQTEEFKALLAGRNATGAGESDGSDAPHSASTRSSKVSRHKTSN